MPSLSAETKKPGAGPGSFRGWGMGYGRGNKLAVLKRNISRKPSVLAQYKAMQEAGLESPLGEAVKGIKKILER